MSATAPAGPAPGDGGRVALALFSVTWAVGSLFHLAKWSLWAQNPAHLALSVAVAFVLLRPGDLVALTGLFAAQAWALASDLPSTTNHLFLAGLIGLLGLLAVAGLAVRPGRRLDAGSLMRDFAPPARIAVVLVFLLAGFAKLNADWFQPETSCGAAFQALLADRFPFLPEGDAVVAVAIVGAVATELAVPFLLPWRRTRAAGLLLGWTFLFAVGIAGFFNFAAITLALLLLFVPDPGGLQAALRSRWRAGDWIAARARAPGVARARRMAALVVAGTAILIALAAPWAGDAAEPILLRQLAARPRPAISYAFEAAWWAWAIGLAVLVALALRAARPRWPSARELFVHPAPALAVVPLLVLLAGVAPYVGLKTESGFTMFSNLRTEGSSNHLLVRRTLDLAGLRGDLVRIESSSDPQLRRIAAEGYLLPMTELKSYLRERARIGDPNVSLTYVRDGRRRVVASAGRDPELTAPDPIVVRKLVSFRPVWTEARVPCRH